MERTQYAGKAYDILKDFLAENYPPALYAKAKVLEGDGKNDEAIKLYQDTLFKNKYYLSAYEIAKKLADENKSYETALLPLADVKSDEILINSYMGYLYENLGNFKEAEKYYLKAVAKNDIDTMYYLGKMYETQNELKKAKNMYTKAYSLGSSEAGERLAFIYENEEQSKNTSQSETLKNKEAKKILERLSKNDISSATVTLSSYYPKNSNKVRILNLKAAVNQYPEAYYNLGVYYFNKKKNKKAKFYFIAAKSTGFDIGEFYEAFLKN